MSETNPKNSQLNLNSSHQKSIFNVIDLNKEVDDFDSLTHNEILTRLDISEIFPINAHIIFHFRVPYFYINLIFDSHKGRNELYRYIRFVTLGKVGLHKLLSSLEKYSEKRKIHTKAKNLSVKSLFNFLDSLKLEIEINNSQFSPNNIINSKPYENFYFHVKKDKLTKNLHVYDPAWIMYHYMVDGAVSTSMVDPMFYLPKTLRYRYPMDKDIIEFDSDLPEFILEFLLWLEQWYKEQRFDYI